MKRKMMLTAGLLIATCVAGCNNGGGGNNNFDPAVLAPIIGQQNAQLLSAGSRALKAASLSQKDEDSIGQSVGMAITNQYPPVKNDNLQRYVNLVGLTVASASPNAGGHWMFGVVESPEVNAFSGPNGYVFITHGAILKMQDEAELAGMLAHEIAHVCNHDGLKQIQSHEESAAFSQAMQAADSRLAQLSVFTDAGIDVVTKTGYSQPQEMKADHDGVTFLIGAGYNPYSYLAFLKRAQSQGVSGGGKMMSTHPGLPQRIDAVTKQLNAAPNSGATLADRFQSNAITQH